MLKLSQKCCLFFCLPINELDFLKQLSNDEKDFVRSFFTTNNKLESWQRYKTEILDPYLTFKKYFANNRVLIIDNGTYADFVSLINSETQDVIILLTHCKDGGDSENEALEFHDKMILSKEILETPFKNYPLLLDISVCNPQFLRKQIQRINPGFACFSSEETKILSIWLMIYASVFSEMHNKRLSFLDAFFETFKNYTN